MTEQEHEYPPSSIKSREAMYREDEDYTDSLCLLLPKGHATLIDVAMFEFAIQFNWYVMGRAIVHVEYSPVFYIRRRCGIGRTGYGNFRYPARKSITPIHRILFQEAATGYLARKMTGNDIDHINRSPWDNRLANLRIATRSQNLQNSGPRKNKSSQYKGVSKVKGKDQWIAQVKLNGKTHYIGRFDDEFEAAQAYNKFIRKHSPEFGYINPLSC